MGGASLTQHHNPIFIYPSFYADNNICSSVLLTESVINFNQLSTNITSLTVQKYLYQIHTNEYITVFYQSTTNCLQKVGGLNVLHSTPITVKSEVVKGDLKNTNVYQAYARYTDVSLEDVGEDVLNRDIAAIDEQLFVDLIELVYKCVASLRNEEKELNAIIKKMLFCFRDLSY